MSIFKRIKARLLGSEGGRAKNRTIRREQATLRRWAQRSDRDRFNV